MKTPAQDHWESVYQRRAPVAVSWYQPRPAVSLELIELAGAGSPPGIIDVGGGASTLVDALLERGAPQVAVLDVSASALAHSRQRLGNDAQRVQWITADVTTWTPGEHYGIWHDRAVFHFLTEAADRRAYVAALERGLAPGGSVIMATFAMDGPERCSGLPVMRHDEASLQRELGPSYQLVQTRRETHLTPAQAEQRFLYAWFRRVAGQGAAP